MKTLTSAPASLAEKNEMTLERLRLSGVSIPEKDAWKKTVGWAKNHPLHAEAVKAGAAWREEMNRESI
jgi:hypothetical protein